MTFSDPDYLKKLWRTNSLEFIAKYEAFPKSRGQWAGEFINLVVNDRPIFYPRDKEAKYSKDVKVYVAIEQSLRDAQYYKIRIRPVQDNSTDNPYLVELDTVLGLEKDYQPAPNFISNWFIEKGESPGDASTIASQLSLNEVELYTHTERFIFELIQNADDMPDGNKSVSIKIELLQSHLLFMHNGCFFTRHDVEAIADAAKSTKTNDSTMTGYKGIGFKSVFSDAKRVYIFSAAYSFRFDKEYKIYSDFWKLYEHYFSRNPEKKDKFKGKESEYTRIDRIPWQIKPIWTTFWQLPNEVQSRWRDKNFQVQIALEVGEDTIQTKNKVGYHRLITNLLKEPRFLLFLKKTRSIDYSLISDNNEIEVHKLRIEERQFTEVWYNDSVIDNYSKHSYDISLNSNDFVDASMSFIKREIEPGKFEFLNDQGGKIDNIPTKLKNRDQSRITFAVRINSGSIDNLMGAGSILFNYLPTSDNRFGFPFLVNADFVTTTNREFIINANQWNHYLLYNIGYHSIALLRKLCLQYPESYLNALIPNLLNTEGNDELAFSSFNRGLIKALREIDFIITTDRETVCCSDVIIDETQLEKTFGQNFFYTLTGTSRKLPEAQIDLSILRRDFLDIDRFEVEHLVNLLAQKESAILFTNEISTLSKSQYDTFLKWLDTLYDRNKVIVEPLLQTLPFLRFGDEILSWSSVANHDNYLLLDKRTSSLRAELTALGFVTSSINIDLFPTLKPVFQAKDTYLNTDSLLYDKMSARCSQYSLLPQQKAALFSLFVGLNRVGEEKHTRTLRLFSDEQGIRRSLDKLLIRNVESLPDWLTTYTIREPEYRLLPLSARNALVRPTTLFSTLFCNPAVLADCTKNLDSRHVSEWVRQLLQWRDKEEPKTTDSGWSDLRWIYTNDTHRFKAAAELWDHDVLTSVPAQAVIESLTGWITPHVACLPLVKKFDLRLRSDKLTDTLVPADTILTESDARLLLGFLIESGESQFLTKFQLVVEDEGFQLRALPAGQRLYISEESLSTYVRTSSVADKLVQFPIALSTVADIDKLSVLTGRTLAAWLVNADATLALTPFVAKSSDLGLHEQFVSRVKLVLRSDIPYERMSLESQFVRLADQIYKRKEGDVAKIFIETVRGNTTVNGDSLDKWRVNDRVRIGKKETGFYSEFRLSELLPEKYKGVSDVVNKLVERFSDSESFVRNKLLDSEDITTVKVVQDLKVLSYLSPLQVIFLQMQAKAQNLTNPLQGFKTFHQYLTDIGKTQELSDACMEYLTILEEKNFDESYIDFNLYNYVDESVSYNEVEALPGYLAAWANNQDKIGFLSKLKLMGRLNEVLCFNGPGSNVVKLRKAMLMGKVDDTWEPYFMDIKRQKLLVVNTILWLTKQLNEVINLNLTVIESLLNETVTLGWTETHVLVADEVGDERRTYQLKKWSGEPVYVLRDDWAEHSFLIRLAIRAKGGWLIDSNTPDSVRLRVKPIDKAFESLIRPNLAELCRPFDADYYLKWESREEYPVLIYERGGFLPYEIWYNSEYIAEDTTSRQVHYLTGKTIFLTKSGINEFPLERPEGVAYQVIEPLVKLKYTGIVKPTDSDESDIDYNPGNEKIKQGQELTKEDQINWHTEAVRRSKDHLTEEGYDFSNCTEKPESFSYKYDSHVKAPNGEYVNVFYRSAKGGLLYLNPGLWQKLADSNNLLIVIYEDGEPRIFTSQESLLQEKYSPYMLYRVKNDKEVSSVNAVAEQLEDGTGHLLFVTGPANYQHLYEMLKP